MSHTQRQREIDRQTQAEITRDYVCDIVHLFSQRG